MIRPSLTRRRTFKTQIPGHGRLDIFEDKWIDFTLENPIHYKKARTKLYFYGFQEFSPRSRLHLEKTLGHIKSDDTFHINGVGDYTCKNIVLGTWRSVNDLVEYHKFWDGFYEKCKTDSAFHSFLLNNRPLMEQENTSPSKMIPMLLLGQPWMNEIKIWKQFANDSTLDRVYPLRSTANMGKQESSVLANIPRFLDSILTRNLLGPMLKHNRLEVTPLMRSRAGQFRDKLNKLPVETEESLEKWISTIEQQMMVYTPEETKNLNRVLRTCQPFASRKLKWARHDCVKGVFDIMKKYGNAKDGLSIVLCVPRSLVHDLHQYFLHKWT